MFDLAEVLVQMIMDAATMGSTAGGDGKVIDLAKDEGSGLIGRGLQSHDARLDTGGLGIERLHEAFLDTFVKHATSFRMSLESREDGNAPTDRDMHVLDLPKVFTHGWVDDSVEVLAGCLTLHVGVDDIMTLNDHVLSSTGGEEHQGHGHPIDTHGVGVLVEGALAGELLAVEAITSLILTSAFLVVTPHLTDTDSIGGELGWVEWGRHRRPCQNGHRVASSLRP